MDVAGGGCEWTRWGLLLGTEASRMQGDTGQGTDLRGRAGHPPEKPESPDPSHVSGGDCLGLRASGRHAPGLGGTRLSRGRGFHSSTLPLSARSGGAHRTVARPQPRTACPTLSRASSQQAEGLKPRSAQLALRSPRGTWAPALQRIRRLHFFLISPKPKTRTLKDTAARLLRGPQTALADSSHCSPRPGEKLPCLDSTALSRPG